MSDEWELYACAMGDHTAYISFDNGIRKTINKLPQKTALKIRVLIDNPTDAGLPQGDEFGVLNVIEDTISAFLASHEGVYLGRITVKGARHFLCLCDAAETIVKDFCTTIRKERNRKIAYMQEADHERNVYWKDLYPTEHDWQLIQDMKVIDSLRKNGDTLTIKRRIDHWLWFKDAAFREHFRLWAEGNAFGIHEMMDHPDDNNYPFGIRIFHEAVPSLGEISHHTIQLHDVAKENSGDYDGWETSVEKG